MNAANFKYKSECRRVAFPPRNPDEDQRVTLCAYPFNLMFLLPGVTILLSLTVFLNMVAETMPATSDAVPLLGKPV